jgi:hypothetical protein
MNLFKHTIADTVCLKTSSIGDKCLDLRDRSGGLVSSAGERDCEKHLGFQISDWKRLQGLPTVEKIT